MRDRGWKGIPAVTLTDAGVRVHLDGLVTIPYRLPDGRLHTVRVFAPDGRCWWRTRGVAPIPFGLEALRDEPDSTLLVVEGESDALTVRAYGDELARLIGVSSVQVIGLPGARSWRPGWCDYLGRYTRGGFILGDGDHAGRAMNERVRVDLPGVTPAWNMPDGYDVRKLVQAHGVEALAEVILDADFADRVWRAFVGSETLEECRARFAREAA